MRSEIKPFCILTLLLLVWSNAVGCAWMSPNVATPSPNQLDIYPDDPEAFLRGYLRAMGDANYVEMKRYAADEITVYAGSTILDSRYGGLGGEDERELNQTVSVEAWVEAYDRTIEALGGRENWTGFADEVDILILKEGDAHYQGAVEPLELQPGDLVCIVNPDGDSGVVVLRRKNVNRWCVVGDFWD